MQPSATGDDSLVRAFPPIAGCRQAEFSVVFTSDPEEVDLHDADGEVLVPAARIRRETPILEEFRLHDSAGPPRLNGMGVTHGGARPPAAPRGGRRDARRPISA